MDASATLRGSPLRVRINSPVSSNRPNISKPSATIVSASTSPWSLIGAATWLPFLVRSFDPFFNSPSNWSRNVSSPRYQPFAALSLPLLKDCRRSPRLAFSGNSRKHVVPCHLEPAQRLPAPDQTPTTPALFLADRRPGCSILGRELSVRFARQVRLRGVELDVVGHHPKLKRIGRQLTRHWYRLVAALKHMTTALVATIPSLPVRTQQNSHAGCQISLRCL